MEATSCSSNFSQSKGLVFGLLLVIAGFLFLSFNFGWVNAAWRPILFSWPMIFIVIGIVTFSKNSFMISLFWFIFGLFFLLPRIGAAFPGIWGIDAQFTRTYWPVLLILIGIIFVGRVFVGNRRGSKDSVRVDSSVVRDGRISRSAVFGGSESIFLEPVFYGGRLSAVFGGVVLDLRKTELPEGDTYLDVDAVFGGIELYIPGNWIVEARVQTMMGGFQDKRHVSNVDKSRKLIIKGDLIFGGCEIR